MHLTCLDAQVDALQYLLAIDVGMQIFYLKHKNT
jgi:hypothetical protein